MYRQHRRSSPQHRRGSLLVLFALMLPVMILLVALAINVAYMQLNRTQMFIATDAATRAGGRELSTTGNLAKAKAMAREAARRNLVAGKPLRLSDQDFTFGVSSRAGLDQKYVFQPGGANPNALKIVARRDARSLDGAIDLLMPNIFSTKSFSVSQESHSTQVELDVAIVLDRSGSMAYGAFEPAAYPPYLRTPARLGLWQGCAATKSLGRCDHCHAAIFG